MRDPPGRRRSKECRNSQAKRIQLDVTLNIPMNRESDFKSASLFFVFNLEIDLKQLYYTRGQNMKKLH